MAEDISRSGSPVHTIDDLDQISDHDTVEPTTPTKRLRGFLADFKEISRQEAPSEGLCFPAAYHAIQKKRAARKAANAGKPRKTARDYLTELAAISRADTHCEGEAFSAAFNHIHEKRRQYVAKRTERRVDSGIGQVDTARIATEAPTLHNQQTTQPPLWEELARAAEYQQAIMEAYGHPKPRSDSNEQSSAMEPNESIQRLNSVSRMLSTRRSNNGESFHDDKPRISHKQARSPSSESEVFSHLADVTASFGSKLKTKINHYSDKREIRKEEKRAKEAEERRSQIKAAISGPLETGLNERGSEWDRSRSVVQLGVLRDASYASTTPDQRLSDPHSISTSDSTSREVSRNISSVSSASETSKTQSSVTTFSTFINPRQPQNNDRVSPMPGKKSANRKGLKLDDVTSSFRNFHFPQLHRSNSDESFECIGAGFREDGSPYMPEHPPMPVRRDTCAELIALYGAPTPGFEQMPGPFLPDKLRNSGQAVAVMPTGMREAMQRAVADAAHMQRSKRDTMADLHAMAGLPGQTMEFQVNEESGRVNSMVSMPGSFPEEDESEKEERHDKEKAKRNAASKRHDTAYAPVYSEGTGHAQGPPSPPPKVPRLRSRDSWEEDTEEYVHPRTGWSKTPVSNGEGAGNGNRRRGTSPTNSYYRMVERDRAEEMS